MCDSLKWWKVAWFKNINMRHYQNTAVKLIIRWHASSHITWHKTKYLSTNQKFMKVNFLKKTHSIETWAMEIPNLNWIWKLWNDNRWNVSKRFCFHCKFSVKSVSKTVHIIDIIGEFLFFLKYRVLNINSPKKIS